MLTTWWSWLLVAILLLSVISAILLRYPSLIYGGQSRHTIGATYHGSHRGGLAERPENTLAAFENCLRAGSQVLELDVYLTRDAQVVVCHDNDLSRICGVHNTISSLDYAQLPPILENLTLPPTFHADNTPIDWDPTPADLEPTSSARRIPLLSEVLQLAHRVTAERRTRFAANGDDTQHIRLPMVSCDLKAGTSELMIETHKVIVACNAESFVVWGGFSDRLYSTLRSKYPTISRFVPGRGALIIVLAYIFGVLPFISLPDKYFQVGYFSEEQMSRMNAKLFGRIPFRHIVRIARWLLIRPLLVSHLQQRGVKVIYWVVNADKDFDIVFGAGADGVMTDAPHLLTSYLKRRQPAMAATLITEPR